MLPIVAGAAAVVVAATIVAIYVASTYKPPPPPHRPIAGIPCEKTAPTGSQTHAELQIYYQGTPVTVPANVGVKQGCLYWLHTNDDSGVIAVDLPKSDAHRTYTLGDFFKIWGQPLSRHQVATLKPGKGQSVEVWVQGKRYQGDPTGIPLSSHQTVVIQVGPPFLDPPPAYTWDTSQYPR